MLTLVEPQLVEETGHESRQKSVKMREKKKVAAFYVKIALLLRTIFCFMFTNYD